MIKFKWETEVTTPRHQRNCIYFKLSAVDIDIVKY